MSKETDSNFAVVLPGETIASITGATNQNDRIEITTQSGRTFVLYHSQDCCETVQIHHIVGDPAELVGQTILSAQEQIQPDKPEGVPDPDFSDSDTWSTFTLVTAKGAVVITWHGCSNGYYSESVSFVEVK